MGKHAKTRRHNQTTELSKQMESMTTTNNREIMTMKIWEIYNPFCLSIRNFHTNKSLAEIRTLELSEAPPKLKAYRQILNTKTCLQVRRVWGCEAHRITRGRLIHAACNVPVPVPASVAAEISRFYIYKHTL
jgi:hypothetical protein